MNIYAEPYIVLEKEFNNLVQLQKQWEVVVDASASLNSVFTFKYHQEALKDLNGIQSTRNPHHPIHHTIINEIKGNMNACKKRLLCESNSP